MPLPAARSAKGQEDELARGEREKKRGALRLQPNLECCVVGPSTSATPVEPELLWLRAGAALRPLPYVHGSLPEQPCSSLEHVMKQAGGDDFVWLPIPVQ